MRRRLAGATAGLVLAAMTAVLGAPAASAACPNEAFRTGPSALLAECRAYEMVTPVDKESGVGTWELGGVHVSPSGDGIYFGSTSAYAGPKGNVLNNAYVASRDGASWTTAGIDGPQAIQGHTNAYTTYAVSDDLGLSFMASKEALAPGAVAGGSNLYVRDNRTGTYTLVLGLPGDQGFYEWSGAAQPNIPFVAASADFSHILVALGLDLTTGAAKEPGGLYEFSDGRLRLAAIGAGRAASTELAPHQMSADGTRFFYTEGNLLYQHRLGESPLLVGEDEEGAPVYGASFVGASPSGEVAYFKGNSTLYRFDASAPAGSRVTNLVPHGESSNYPEVSAAYADQAGSTIYFTSPQRLTPDARPVETQGYYLYVWHGAPGGAGEVRYVGTSEVDGGLTGEAYGPVTAGVSPDGRFFGFETFGDPTTDAIAGSAGDCPVPDTAGNPGRCSNVFLYSLDSGRLACVSCSGSPPLGNSRLGGKEHRFENVTVPLAVLDDGTIFFDTPNALSARDANGILDVYGWRAGTTQLISTGSSTAPSSFDGADADGTDAFFQTDQELVGQDVDASTDLYDARIGGGLPQGATPPTPSCIVGNDCRSGTTVASTPPTPASTDFGGAGNVPRSCSALLGRARAAKKHSRELTRRARKLEGSRARSLNRAAERAARTGRKLDRKAGTCRGVRR